MLAAVVHFVVSLVVCLVVAVLFWFQLYTTPFATVARLAELLLLIVMIDVLIGPFITFVVYRQGKPGLAKDLSVIAFIQVLALAYGSWTAWQGKPAFVVLVGQQFNVLTAAEWSRISPTDRALVEAPLVGFEVVGTVPPIDPAEKNKLVLAAMQGLDLQHFPRLYTPLAATTSNVQKSCSDLRILKEFDEVAYARAARILHAETAGGRAVAKSCFVRTRFGQGELAAVFTNGEYSRPRFFIPARVW